MKVDLCMWTKNGAKTLPIVLERINKVIPKEQVGEKYIVDDRSRDSTICYGSFRLVVCYVGEAGLN